ncbi:MAG: hypothetical protein ACRERC_07195 [Candidatus Binatia bacterium]
MSLQPQRSPGVARQFVSIVGTGVGARRLLVLLGLLLGSVAPATAHLPQMRGRLIDLVSQSDVIVIATVERTRAAALRQHDTTVRVEEHIAGLSTPAEITFRSARRFAPGKRYTFFLRREATGLVCAQPSGTVFAARPEDDASYRQTVAAIQRALRTGAAEHTAALRAAIIPALSSPAPALRFHAVLELGALAHHGLADADRQALERVAADPRTDATIRPIVSDLLAAQPASIAAPVR